MILRSINTTAKPTVLRTKILQRQKSLLLFQLHLVKWDLQLLKEPGSLWGERPTYFVSLDLSLYQILTWINNAAIPILYSSVEEEWNQSRQMLMYCALTALQCYNQSGRGVSLHIKHLLQLLIQYITTTQTSCHNSNNPLHNKRRKILTFTKLLSLYKAIKDSHTKGEYSTTTLFL